MKINTILTIEEAATFAARGLYDYIDIADVTIKVAIEKPVPPDPPVVNYSMSTNPHAGRANLIFLIKMVRTLAYEIDAKIIKHNAEHPTGLMMPTLDMDLTDGKRWIENYLEKTIKERGLTLNSMPEASSVPL